MAKTTHSHKAAPSPVEDIDLKLDGGYIVASHEGVVTIYEALWESRHTERTRHLVIRKCKIVPRQFERLVYGPATT
jgi:hypothetical protein